MSRPTPLLAAPPVAGGRDLDLPGDGIRLAGTRWPGSGTPVLLLHGLASQRRYWNLLVPHLAGLPLVALDQRGHGDSDAPDDGYDAATVVRDVTTALDALGLSRAVVVGHSWGAGVAFAMAATHPERVLAVVALDGGLASPREHMALEEAREALAPPRIEVPPDKLRGFFRGGRPGIPWSPEYEAAVLPIFGVGDDGLARARLSREHHMRLVDALWEYDPVTLLPQVAVPCWAALSAPLVDEPDVREWQSLAEKRKALDRAATLLPAPRLLTLGGAVHDVPLQWPALVAGIVRAAVGEVARPEGVG